MHTIQSLQILTSDYEHYSTLFENHVWNFMFALTVYVFFRFLAPDGAHFYKKGDSSGAGDARLGQENLRCDHVGT